MNSESIKCIARCHITFYLSSSVVVGLVDTYWRLLLQGIVHVFTCQPLCPFFWICSVQCVNLNSRETQACRKCWAEIIVWLGDNIFQWKGSECTNDRAYLFILTEWGSRSLTEADEAIHRSHNIFPFAHFDSSQPSHLKRRLLPCTPAQPTYPIVLVAESYLRLTVVTSPYCGRHSRWPTYPSY